MTRRGDAIAIALLKNASTASQAAHHAERAGKAIKSLVRGAADAGGGLAKGLGAHEGAGRAAGVAALGAGTLVGGRKVKQKYDQMKFRLMYGDGMYY